MLNTHSMILDWVIYLKARCKRVTLKVLIIGMLNAPSGIQGISRDIDFYCLGWVRLSCSQTSLCWNLFRQPIIFNPQPKIRQKRLNVFNKTNNNNKIQKVVKNSWQHSAVSLQCHKNREKSVIAYHLSISRK